MPYCAFCGCRSNCLSRIRRLDVARGPSFMTSRLMRLDRKSTRLNSSHQIISYAVFCLKKKKIQSHSELQQPCHSIGLLAQSLALQTLPLCTPRHLLPTHRTQAIRYCVFLPPQPADGQV